MDRHALRESLMILARNHRWAWSHHARAVFDALPCPPGQQHPARIVANLDQDQLEALTMDEDFVGRLSHHSAELASLTATSVEMPAVAYFSPEFGISELVPQYSGGLGVLAGDHLKAASDLNLSLGAVGLFYRKGFFRQSIDHGEQIEHYEAYAAEDLGCISTGVEVTIPIATREVTARVWQLNIGRIPLLLLDTDLAENRPADRTITDRLYSGDRRHRLQQEMVLGVGGVRALRECGWEPDVFHLNEGHAGFLLIELLDELISRGDTLTQALAAIGPRLVFTTHTPVPAGIERFDRALTAEHLQPWALEWGLPVDDLLELGTAPDDRSSFNMAALCLRVADRANGVSKLHGEVSRELFADLSGGPAITSITNGVHARSWVAPQLQETLDSHLGPDWANGDADCWTGVDRIDDDAIREARRTGAETLREVVRDRVGAEIRPDSLIIGFARRFTAYKRATLLLQHAPELGALLADEDRPVQFVFAGKAHPSDVDGKAMLAHIISYGSTAEANGRFIFVPDYDMALARAMYAGCDVWLNTPERSREASGTSGEKAALNGGLNCSISDGWWDEMADGRNGWTIPACDHPDVDVRDRTESASALRLISQEIAPEYFGEDGPWSTAWIERIRDAWRSLGPQVTAGRMVSEYASELYEPAIRAVRRG